MASPLFTLHKRIRLAEIDSTNSYALRLLAQNPEEGTIVQAEFQSRGRGQQGNSWNAPAGLNLTFSLICYPNFLPIDRMFQLSKAVSLALQQSAQRFVPDKRLEIKWPNDLLLERKKVAGILIENQLEGRLIKSSVIGVGLNVNQQQFSPELKTRACAMRHFSAEDLDREAILTVFLEEFEAYYQQLKKGNHGSLDRQYYENLYGYQETIALRNADGLFEGQIIGVGSYGKLAVQVGQELVYYDFKEVQFILP
jgi:BirA family biotin operon repressor/biotin-[acetyl-CoA-carboxylase] ligase